MKKIQEHKGQRLNGFSRMVGKGSLATDEHGLTQIIFAAQINTGTRMKKIQNHGGMEIQRIH